jgi:lactoylglutathione lyase
MRYLHTMIRVGDIDRSVNFYHDVLGFNELRRSDHPEDKFTLVFMQARGDANTDNGPMLELTYNYAVDSYELGNGYGHIALEVDSMDQLAVKLQRTGHTFSWGPGVSPDGSKKMAFLTDPDGYKIELLEYITADNAPG